MTITSSSLQNSVLGNLGITNQFMPGYSVSNKTSFSCLGMPSQSPAVCPLLFGDLQSKDSNFNFDTPSRSNFGTAAKLSSPSINANEKFARENPYGKAMALSNPIEAGIKDTIRNLCEIGCDLSLRLGCLSSPREIIETNVDKDLGNLYSRSPQENKLIDLSLQIDKSFLEKSYMYESVDTCSTDQILEAEKLNLKESPRKGKEVMDHPREDEHISWHLKLPFHDCIGRARNAEP